MKLFLLGSRASLRDLIEVACLGRGVALPKPARARIAASRRVVEAAAVSGEPVYGINTGFGPLASKRIPPGQARELQRNFIHSHSSGVGEPLSPEASRAIIFLRANEFARGRSGCRVEVVEFLAALVNRGVSPVIPSRGSVGASGDLAPQAHAALLVLGEGKARILTKGRWGGAVSGAQALKRARLRPLVLEAKEGLTLANGTQAMQAVGGLAIHRAQRVLAAANLAGAFSLEAIRGTPVPYEEALVGLKRHPGPMWVARQLRGLLRDSEIRESHRFDDPRVQDPYSFRCIPQVHGAAADGLAFARNILEAEMESSTDNPAVVGRRIISGGNFHGQELALGFDTAAVAVATLGNVSERRMAQLVSGEHGLHPFLARDPGLESGFMIPQYAAAALASENKTLAHPASADSIPTSAGKEDFVSMGMLAALKLDRIVFNAAQIVGIELLAAAHAVELHRPLRPGTGVARALELLRRRVPRTEGDEVFSGLMERLRDLILDGYFEEVASWKP